MESKITLSIAIFDNDKIVWRQECEPADIERTKEDALLWLKHYQKAKENYESERTKNWTEKVRGEDIPF